LTRRFALGGTGVLMQGGRTRTWASNGTKILLRTLSAKYPRLSIALLLAARDSQPSSNLGLDYETIMALERSGASTVCRGGGYDDERKKVATKCTTGEWLAVMRAVHRVGLRSQRHDDVSASATGIEHRVRHLQRIRDLQDETGGFTAFIPWTFQRENTALGRRIKDEPTGIEIENAGGVRLFLDNIDNLQSSWLTQGLRLDKSLCALARTTWLDS